MSNAIQTRFMQFRQLDDDDIEKFRQAAREKYVLFTPIDGIWHPIYQAECVKMNHEAAIYQMEAREVDDGSEEG